jgi:hypothetical protein
MIGGCCGIVVEELEVVALSLVFVNECVEKAEK